MIPQLILRSALLPLLVTCLTLPLRLTSPTLLLPSQNNNNNDSTTTPSPLATNHTLVGVWPAAPFTRHLSHDTDIQILNRKPPPPTDLTPEMAILASISVIAVKARYQSRLATIRDFRAENGPVNFEFRATEDFFRGRDVARVLDVLWQMTHLYGKAEVYGSLVRAGIHTAYFELGLRKGEGVR